MSEAVAHETLFQGLTEGTLLLTAGSRLARTLTEAHAAWRKVQGASAWETPAILPWERWLERLWEEALLFSSEPLPLLMGRHQARRLWREAVRREEISALIPGGLAEQLQKSWERLHQWRLSLDDPLFQSNEESFLFAKLARRFRALCRRRQLLTADELPERLAQLAGILPLPECIELAGFELLTPAQEWLLDALEEEGVKVRRLAPPAAGRRAWRLAAADPGVELELACAWARARLEEDPRRRLAIVIPDLQRRRDEVEHRLGKIFEPGGLAPGAGAGPRPWNLSLGRPLAEQPQVEIALALLELAAAPLPPERVELLLRSPWLAGAEEERFQRAKLLRRLREKSRFPLGLTALLHHASALDAESGGPLPWNAPRLSRSLARLEAAVRETGRAPCSPSRWAERFTLWLEAGGWVTSGLDSHHFQVLERWRRLLEEYRALDLVAGTFSLGEALVELGAMARGVLFQPQSPPAPLQVLGLYEVSGLAFDGLWVVGLHEGAWPALPPPDPFLPLSLQRERRMPGVDPGRELELAGRWTRRLAESAPEVIFSHPRAEGSEPLSPSPLLHSYPETEAAALGVVPPPRWEERIREKARLELLERDEAPPLSGRVPGGTALFRHQANCPFRAFAEERLRAEAFPAVRVGLDAAGRGTLLHRALEILWEKLGDQATLRSLDGAALRREVDNAVSAALARLEVELPGLFGPRGRNLEARRLKRLLLQWLELEKERAPFRVVARELHLKGRSGPVEYRLFIDRLDELEDGRRLVIDYKSGRVSPSAWFGERPEDPQLPLYATTLETAPVGVAFAVLRAGEIAFKGVAAEAGLLPDVPPSRPFPEQREAMEDWAAALARWRRTLDRLACAFAAGEAAVDPKRGAATCRETYCQLQPLCRFHSAEEAGHE